MTAFTRRGVLAAFATACAAQRQSWKPKLGILGRFTEVNLEFAKTEGFTSMGLWSDPGGPLDAMRITDEKIEQVKSSISRSGLYISVIGATMNHISPDPGERARVNAYFAKVIELAGRLGVPHVGTASGKMPGGRLDGQVSEIVRVYTEKYFPVCERHKVRILWEPWPDGPNIATGPVGYEALFQAFGNSPHVGLQYDPSHAVRMFIDTLRTARDFADRIYDVHLKDTEIRWEILHRTGIHPLNEAQWWRYRLPGLGSIDWAAFFTILMDAGFHGAMNVEHEDPLYGPDYEGDNFTEAFKTGFRMAHRYLRQFVPA